MESFSHSHHPGGTSTSALAQAPDGHFVDRPSFSNLARSRTVHLFRRDPDTNRDFVFTRPVSLAGPRVVHLFCRSRSLQGTSASASPHLHPHIPATASPVLSERIPVSLGGTSPSTAPASSTSPTRSNSSSSFSITASSSRVAHSPTPADPARSPISISYEQYRGGRRCYTFHLQRTERSYKVYKCTSCDNLGRYVPVKVIGDCFMEDPVMLRHCCLPKKFTVNTVQRIIFGKMQEIRKDAKYSEIRARRVWQDLLEEIPEMPHISAEEVLEIVDEYHAEGYARRRRTIARNIEVHQKPLMDLDNLPAAMKNLPDGTPFLQYRTTGFYVFFSRTTVEKAVENGLTAIVADGVHKLPPDVLGDNAQLYTLHAVCNAGIDVPMIHVLTKRKNQSTYEKIFELLKQELQVAGHDCRRIRIIIDFERAALAGIKKNFDERCIEGCAFHMSQSWNRRAHTLGLKRDLKIGRIKQWWLTLKGLIFLPMNLHRKVPALYRPPVPRSHPAYSKCASFLRYVKEKWYSGPFKFLWQKWDKRDLRTSNIAESYHRVLRVLIPERHASVRRTLMCIRGADVRAMATLRNLERGIFRRLRRKDDRRRRKIDNLMDEYRPLLLAPCPSTATIVHYCKKMSRFVSEKVV